LKPARYALLAALALGWPLNPASAAACGSPPSVTLDIGHTPERPGALSARGRTEYSFNRELALDLDAALRAKGIEVGLHNEAGDDISLGIRGTQLATVSRGVVLSLHHDSVQPVYLQRGLIGGKPSTFTRFPKARGYSIFVSGRSPSFAASDRFARSLGAALRQAGFRPSSHHAEPIKGENRPVLDAKLGVFRFDALIVLRSARVPAALFEGGVIVNPEEEAELEDPGRRALMVRALANGVAALCAG
jgi:N-acetylmuramoyl-L-alanine amidase